MNGEYANGAKLASNEEKIIHRREEKRIVAHVPLFMRVPLLFQTPGTCATISENTVLEKSRYVQSNFR
jgi:hypothetical protein